MSAKAEDSMGLNSSSQATRLLEAAACQAPVLGLTHNFYRYPARFSPQLARAIIETFSKPGELVVDPFMGGGTALVEAACLGRPSVGSDLSSLAVFVARAKTRPLTSRSIGRIRSWARRTEPSLSLRGSSASGIRSGWESHLRNFSCRMTWRIRNTAEELLELLADLPQKNERQLLRCALLRTSQWAVDGRKKVPSVAEFRQRFFVHLEEMLTAVAGFRAALQEAGSLTGSWRGLVPSCAHLSAESLDLSRDLCGVAPRLVLTSPPYPGVHMLYHRWQVGGGRETPAPFWIANCRDGHGAAHYTFGDRKSHDRGHYYDRLESSFAALSRLCNDQTRVVQVVGFSDPRRQLPRYLRTMEKAGFVEDRLGPKAKNGQRRLWRTVPNRRWYADQRGRINSSKEVVLLHRPR